MIGGLHGKILDINLSDKKVETLELPDEYGYKYIGGRGIGVKLLLDNLWTGDAFAPENPLIFMTGPVVGLDLGGTGRHATFTKSPASGFLGEAYSGGFFGTELKRSGFDGIMIKGISDTPVYLSIIEGKPVLNDATNLWGKGVFDTTDYLLNKHGEGKVSCIGQGGENLVRFASIMNDWTRANGRTGSGAVMGSKKLKAIYCKGHTKLEPKNPDAFKEAKKHYIKTLITPEHKNFGKFGTPGGIEGLHEMGILPTKNWQAGQFEGKTKISGETLYDTLLEKRNTCTSCPVRCKREVETVVLGEKIIPKEGGPEYETIGALGSLCLNDDLKIISLANKLCNDHGLDTISTGAVIAFSMEAHEKGLINDGIHWGDGPGIIKLVRDIAFRRNTGKILGEGVLRASKQIGGEDFAIHVKGVELPMHEARGKKGLGLSYACTPRGANHMEGFHDTGSWEGDNGSPQLGITEGIDRFETKGKANLVFKIENVYSFINSLIMCVFDTMQDGAGYNLHNVHDIVNAVTGLEIDTEEMLTIGHRNYTLGRLFGTKQGLSTKDDDLPERIKTQALDFYGRKEALFEDELNLMKKDYYELRGWDTNGIPTQEELNKLSIHA